jgi:glycosyltransferase involved in cell wall biosynthesis
VRVVVDLQSAQAALRRGDTPAEASALTRAVLARATGHEVWVALSGLLEETIEPLRAALDGWMPQARIRVWYARGPVAESNPANRWRRETAERIREAFLASLKPDWVVTSGLLDGFDEELVWSIGELDKTTATLAILHEPGGPFGAARNPAPAEALTNGMPRRIESVKRARAWLMLAAENPAALVEALGLAPERVACQPVDGDWDAAAARILELCAEPGENTSPPQHRSLRPRLAYVSPLPPTQSGIAEYSADLLPELARYYSIDVITCQEVEAASWVAANCAVRSPEWLLENPRYYDRVLYHFGNSPFHSHMYELLERVPGTVVLHDFQLGELSWHRGSLQPWARLWERDLFQSHGYAALRDAYPESRQEVISRYPCNLDVLRGARGVIVHSQRCRELAARWYGPGQGADWIRIPAARPRPEPGTRAAALNQLGYPADAFLVCCFGLLGPGKLNHELLRAWLASRLAADPDCQLIFVGGTGQADAHASELQEIVKASAAPERVRITGWVSRDTYQTYLRAASIGVQLRLDSLGETSAAVLDCMNYGLPVIVNTSGSSEDLPPDAVCRLEADFTISDLTQAMEQLWRSPELRQALAASGQRLAESEHRPQRCAARYAAAIEHFEKEARRGPGALIESIAELGGPAPGEADLRAAASAIARSIPPACRQRQWLVDVTAICARDLKTGIQRVIRALVLEWIACPPANTRVEPVYLSRKTGTWRYHYARDFTLKLLGCPNSGLEDDCIDFAADDVLVSVDLAVGEVVEAKRAGVYRELRTMGVEIHFLVYDLLPLRMPQHFPPPVDRFAPTFEQWMETISREATAIECISRSVELDLEEWLSEHRPERSRPLRTGHFHLGADLRATAATHGVPANAEEVLAEIARRPTFLMVGTIDPRKGHEQTLAAFDVLWRRGVDVTLVMVGAEGWKARLVEPHQTVPSLAERLIGHPEAGRRLIWLADASDEYLERLYASCQCLIAAAEGEGFGLPLIEAAQHKLPILARDIPIFVEVAGPHAAYFHGESPEALADSIENWLERFGRNQHPRSDELPWLTWKQSARQLAQLVLASEAPAGHDGDNR